MIDFCAVCRFLALTSFFFSRLLLVFLRELQGSDRYMQDAQMILSISSFTSRNQLVSLSKIIAIIYLNMYQYSIFSICDAMQKKDLLQVIAQVHIR